MSAESKALDDLDVLTNDLREAVEHHKMGSELPEIHSPHGWVDVEDYVKRLEEISSRLNDLMLPMRGN